MTYEQLAARLTADQIAALNRERPCNLCSFEDRLVLVYYGLITINDARDGGREFDPTTPGLVVRAIRVNRPLAFV